MFVASSVITGSELWQVVAMFGRRDRVTNAWLVTLTLIGVPACLDAAEGEGTGDDLPSCEPSSPFDRMEFSAPAFEEARAAYCTDVDLLCSVDTETSTRGGLKLKFECDDGQRVTASFDRVAIVGSVDLGSVPIRVSYHHCNDVKTSWPVHLVLRDASNDGVLLEYWHDFGDTKLDALAVDGMVARCMGTPDDCYPTYGLELRLSHGGDVVSLGEHEPGEVGDYLVQVGKASSMENADPSECITPASVQTQIFIVRKR